jgi:amino acid transporter
MSQSQTTSSESSLAPRSKLKLWEALALSVGLMGPTLAMSLNGQGVAGLVGKSVPLVFLIGFVAVLAIAYGFWRLTQHFNHAGSVYALAGVTLGPRAGFFGGFALLGTYVFFAACTMAATGVFLQAFLDAAGIKVSVPWILTALLTAVACAVFNSRESRVTARTLLIVEGVGIACMTILSVVIVARTSASTGARAAFDLSLFTFGGAPASEIATASVFAFLSWAGFEACAALGEETDNPKRNIPRALMGSVLLTGLLFVFVMYAQTIGFLHGPDGIDGFSASSSSVSTLSERFIGTWFALVVGFSAFAAGFASALSSSAAASRLVFALARDGFGPKALARTNPHTKAPVVALITVLAVASVLDIALSFGGVAGFDAYYWYATLGVLCVLVVYAVAGAGVVRFIASRRAPIPLWQIVIPVVSIAYLAYVFYVQSTGQKPPISYFPLIAGLWCLTGLTVVLVAPGLARRIGESLTSELSKTDSDVDEIVEPR